MCNFVADVLRIIYLMPYLEEENNIRCCHLGGRRKDPRTNCTVCQPGSATVATMFQYIMNCMVTDSRFSYIVLDNRRATFAASDKSAKWWIIPPAATRMRSPNGKSQCGDDEYRDGKGGLLWHGW